MKIINDYEFIYCAPFIRFKLIINKESNDYYGFYIIRNNEKIFIKDYDKNNEIIFDTNYIPGIYRIAYFIKNCENKNWGESSSKFLNPIEYAYERGNGNLDKPLVCDAVSPIIIKSIFAYHMLYFPKKGSNKLLVLLPSAVSDNTKRQMPIFHRWRWALNGVFDGNVLCVSESIIAALSGITSFLACWG